MPLGLGEFFGICWCVQGQPVVQNYGSQLDKKIAISANFHTVPVMEPNTAAALSSRLNASRIRALFLDMFVKAARKHGCNTTQLLRDVGLSGDILDSPYAWVKFSQYVAFTERVAEQTGNPLIGLELGTGFSPAELGPFHVLTMTLSAPRDVLHAFIKFQNHWQTHSSLEVHEVDEERTELRYVAGNDDIWPRRQDTEFSIASIATCLRHALAGQWRPIEVRFQHDISAYRDVLKANFNCPVRGDAPHTGIVIPSRLLRMSEPPAARSRLDHLNPVLEAHLMDLMRVEQDQDDDIIEQVRLSISKRLAGTSVTFFAVATDLGIPERSLRRYLAQNNVSFRELLQQQRMRRACQLLESSAQIPLEMIAEQLGYADAASFGRAFKDWKGVSPRRFSRSATQRKTS
ncbi:AraC family transcriptional regulator [Phaeobacter sp. HF9A]|uniref:AraC family transcriptional regulator n=1 Tax=Phaeobacter sp. HF9A TaxID=2721561 RepID=UPI00143162F4|nr:AraC family transcriptional regulator [Phaeobacter sp. HF9A]NIZ12070.1 AraC family transcriptional regulator [Phaeobacter sp. HF9A]